jgi:ribonuclease VapC
VIVDTSAIAAILFDEPEAERIEDALVEAAVRRISAATALELAMVVEARLGEPGARELDLLLYKANVAVVPFDAEHLGEAVLFKGEDFSNTDVKAAIGPA